MDGQAGSGEQFLVADVTFEMLCLLVLDQDLLIVKLPIAVPESKPHRLVWKQRFEDNQSTESKLTQTHPNHWDALTQRSILTSTKAWSASSSCDP